MPSLTVAILAGIAALAQARSAELGRHRLTNQEAGELAAGVIEAAALPGGPPPTLLLAVIEAESEYADRCSPTKCCGVTQMSKRTWCWMAGMAGVAKDRRSLRQQARLGGAYLHYLHDRRGTWRRSLLSYSTGPTAASYTAKVLRRWRYLNERIRHERERRV